MFSVLVVRRASTSQSSSNSTLQYINTSCSTPTQRNILYYYSIFQLRIATFVSARRCRWLVGVRESCASSTCGKKMMKCAYRCGLCQRLEHNIQSCAYTEGNIPTKSSSQSWTVSEASGNEYPFIIDSEDERNKRNVILPIGSSALHQPM